MYVFITDFFIYICDKLDVRPVAKECYMIHRPPRREHYLSLPPFDIPQYFHGYL